MQPRPSAETSSFPSFRFCMAVTFPCGVISRNALTLMVTPTSRPAQEMVERQLVLRLRHHEDEEKEREARDDVLVEGVERLLEQMTERDDHQDRAEPEKRLPRAEP